MNYLTSECNYGGRITDNNDRRLISTILKKFYSPDIFANEPYRFFDVDNFFIPGFSTYNEYIDYITKLPITVEPEVIGLHKNANMLRNYQDSQQLIDSIILTLPQRSKEDFNSNERIINEVCANISLKINEFDLEIAKEKFPVSFTKPMNSVLIQELTNFNRLIQVLQETIAEVNKSFAGKKIISESSEKVYESMLIGKTPEIWLKNSYLSIKSLGNYINDLSERIAFFQDWLINGQPRTFWISGFFSSKGFITGVMQSHARKNNIPIDLLDLDFTFTNHRPEDILEVPNNRIYIHGLFMQGARWCKETNAIQESLSKVFFDHLPVIYFEPKNKKEINMKESDEKFYKCPVYNTSIRQGAISATGNSTNFIMTLHVPSDKEESHWIIRSNV